MKMVLDASAFLRYTDDEAGAERVTALLKSARAGDATLAMSAVNWSEVSHIFHKRFGKHTASRALRAFKALPFEIADLDEPSAEAAALLRLEHQLPFADSFAAALAQTTDAILLTADFDFKPASKSGALNVEFLPAKRVRN